MATSTIKQVTGMNISRALSSGDDLNSLNSAAQAGAYTVAASAANNPNGAWGLMFVFASSSVGTAQLFLNKTEFWVRVYSGSNPSWGPWRKITAT